MKSIKRKVDRIEGYRLNDIQIFEDIITSLACPECCEKTLYVEEDLTKKKGLATYISVLCECGYAKENYTPKAVINNPMSNKKGMKPFEINTRAVYALRSCGVGHTGLEKICCILNMPKPMTVMNCNNISNNIRDSAKQIAERSMNNAAVELKRGKNMVIDIGVSLDGSWQRRGFSSMNGVVTAISIDTGKIIDIESMSRYCRQCFVIGRSMEDDQEAFSAWQESHKLNCRLNYSGSAPSMEPAGAKRIFERSIEKRGVRYMSFYGDGDSKAYKEVENVYGEEKVTKYECIGHYQKRVGNRLRKLKKRKRD